MVWMKQTNRAPFVERGHGGFLNLPAGRPLPPGRGGYSRPSDPRTPPPNPNPYKPPKPGPAPLLAPAGFWYLAPEGWSVPSAWTRCPTPDYNGSGTCGPEPMPTLVRWYAWTDTCISYAFCAKNQVTAGWSPIGTPPGPGQNHGEFAKPGTIANRYDMIRQYRAPPGTYTTYPGVIEPMVQPTSLDPAEAPEPETWPDPYPEWWPGKPRDPVYDPEKRPGPWNPPSPWQPKVRPQRRRKKMAPPPMVPPELPEFGDGDGPGEGPGHIWPDPYFPPYWPVYPGPAVPGVQPAPSPMPTPTPGPPAPPYNPVQPQTRYQVPALQWELKPEGKITVRKHVHDKVKNKDKKVRLPYWMAVAVGAYHSATEVNDFIESLADAMPDDRCSNLPGFQRALCVLDNWRHIDPLKAAQNVIANEIEDRLVGRTIGALGRRSGGPYGVPSTTQSTSTVRHASKGMQNL